MPPKKGYKQSEDHIKKRLESKRGYRHSDETKKKISKARTGQKASDETKRKLSESHKGLLCGDKNPMFGKKHKDSTIDKLRKASSGENNPMYGKHHTKEAKLKMSKVHKGSKRPPRTDEYRKKISDALIEYCKSPDVREKRSKAKSGKNHHNWRGGISYEPYCYKFNNTIKDIIREKYDRKCFICGKPETNRKHSIHHVGYNKSVLCNGQSWGLIPLCGSCHSKTNFNRWYWFGLLGNYWVYPYIEEGLVCSLY